jgi:membrane protein
VIEVIEEIGPDSAAETFAGPVESIASHRGAAGLALLAGLGVAVWSASGYVGAFSRASDVVYGRSADEPFWKQRPRQIALTLALLAMAGLLAGGLVLSGPVVDAVAGSIGVGSTAVSLWEVLKLPAMGLIFVAMVGLLFSASRGASLRPTRWFTPGSFVAVGVWAVASLAFALYLGNFGSYDQTYGTLGGVVALLVWLWITNLSILFGHALNAQMERR